MILLSVPLAQAAPSVPAPFVSVETWQSVFDGSNRSASDQARSWQPVLERLRDWVRTVHTKADQTQVSERASREGLFRGATGVNLAWTASPVISSGRRRTFVFDLIVSKRVDSGLLPTRSAYAVVEPARAQLLSLVPAPLGKALDLSAARRGPLLAVAGGILPNPASERERPFAAVFRLQNGEWRTLARRIGPPVESLTPFRVLATVPASGVLTFNLQRQFGPSPRFQSFETWRLEAGPFAPFLGSVSRSA